MGFGKSKNRDEVSFEAPHWNEITEFTVGTMMRDTFRRATRGEGAHAVRFRRAGRMLPFLHIVPVDPARPLAKAGFRLFEDEDGRRLLCAVLPDSSDRYRVTDAENRELGAVRRAPVAKRLTQQSLELEQPGHPPVVAPRAWARGGVAASVGRGAGHVLDSVVDSVLSFGGTEGASDSGAGPGPVVWAARPESPEGTYGEPVLTCPRTTGSHNWYVVQRDGRLDKRLAFALAVLRESEGFGADRR